MRRLLLCLLVCCSLASKAQGILELRLDGSEEGKPLTAVLANIKKNTHARFYFLPSWIEPIVVQRNYKGITLADMLDDLFLGSDLNFFEMYPNAVVIVKDPTQAMMRKRAIADAIQQQKKIIKFAFGQPGKTKRDKVTISGRITDSKNQEPMVHANIQVPDTPIGTTTDAGGNYVLTIPPGTYVLNYSFVDHEDKVVDLAAYSDGQISLQLDEMPIVLDEVVISGNGAAEVTTGRIGQTQITMREIRRAPSMLGEADLVKQIQLLPGVTTVGEAASGFNVRGGSVDQNLILYDGQPVYNSSHVFGFLSAFNPEAMQGVTFYKGGIPSEYGGRASSVLDIRSKDGDFEKWGGNAGIGLITSNFMINGPITKKKTSIIASVRSTYSDYLVHAIRTNYADLRKSSVRFYDGTLKLTHRFNEATKLSVTGYASQDGFRLTGDTTYQWRNLQLSSRLDHQFSNELSSEFVAGVSNYSYSVTNADEATASKLEYQITTANLKAGFNYQRGDHRYTFGWQLQHYTFEPGTLQPNSPVSNTKPITLDKQYSLENAFYGSDSWSVRDKYFFEAGLRLPVFMSFGPATVYKYQSGQPMETGSITDTTYYGKGKPIKTYFGVEPRLSVRYMLSPSSSIKFGYNRIYQFLQLVTNTTAVTPIDIWQPSGYYFKPQRADQVSLGYFTDFSDRKYAASIEGFYKYVKNIIDFKDGAQLILNNHLETDLLQGKGHSYGIETAISRNVGRLTGSLNYTYSRSFRIIPGINDGNKYPSSFDQPNIINLAWKYNLSRRYYFTGNFTYHTGRPVTIPLSAFPFEHTQVGYFSDRNQHRIPDYHRLDLALVLEGNHRRKPLLSGTWVFSFYNVYARQNPYTVFFRSTGNGIPQPYQLSIVGTIVPSVSYNVKF